MNAIERLVSAGMSRDNAGEACKWFCSKEDEAAFEKYIEECEKNAERVYGNV